jgi:hypothetical protein
LQVLVRQPKLLLIFLLFRAVAVVVAADLATIFALAVVALADIKAQAQKVRAVVVRR